MKDGLPEEEQRIENAQRPRDGTAVDSATNETIDLPNGRVPTGSAPVGRSLRVLVAEDDAISRMLAVKVLEKRGHRVVGVETGEAAVAAAASQTFDVVVMDLEMHEVDGYQATAQLRAMERDTGVHLPIVALTAHAIKGQRERCLAAGMDDYLTKPVDPADLIAALDHAAPTGGIPLEPLLEPPIDLERLTRMLDDDRETVDMVVALFLENLPKQLEGMRQAVEDNNHEALQAFAHRVKGSAASLGAEGALRITERLSSMAADQNTEGAGELLDRLGQEIERIAAYVALDHSKVGGPA